MSERLPSVRLKPDKEKAVRHRHPWIFSGAIARVEGAPQPGGSVDVHSAQGEFLARGYYNPHSQITVRLFKRFALMAAETRRRF